MSGYGYLAWKSYKNIIMYITDDPIKYAVKLGAVLRLEFVECLNFNSDKQTLVQRGFQWYSQGIRI